MILKNHLWINAVAIVIGIILDAVEPAKYNIPKWKKQV